MSLVAFDAFKAELAALKSLLEATRKKTVRDEPTRDRFRNLFRTWSSVLAPSVEPLLRNKREFHKLTGELEALAKLTSRTKKVEEYRRRLTRTMTLANALVLYLPVTGAPKPTPRALAREELFTSGIPDLPVSFVPNPLIGWKTKIENFLERHPFDRSVFIMIRYRQRNDTLLSSVKRALADNHLTGILASEHNLTDDLYNPIACLLCCSKGIAVFDEPDVQQVFNPNVAYELGMMHLLGRNCLILKHKTLQSLHTDILMRLYKEYSSPNDARDHTNTWIANQ